MNKRYFIKKPIIKSKDVEKMIFYFSNGDTFTFNRGELKDYSFEFLDKLIYMNSKISLVAAHGKLVIEPNRYSYYEEYRHYGLKNEKRVDCLKRRCVDNQELIRIVFDVNDEYINVYGNFITRMEDNILHIELKEKYDENEYSDEFAYIELGYLKKEFINYIELGFENCESARIYEEEILEPNFIYGNELINSSDGFVRQIEGGYLKIRIRDQNYYREQECLSKISFKNKIQLEKRICGKYGETEHDICVLYVGTKFPFYKEEKILIKEARVNIDILEEEDDEYFYPYFIGGIAKKQEDGTIIIYFNKLETFNKY